MRDLLLLLLLAGALPLSFAWPILGAAMYIVVSVGSVHTLAYGFVASFPWAILYSLVLLISAIFGSKVSLVDGLRRYAPFIPVLIAFSLSTLVHHDAAWTLDRYVYYLKIQLGLILILAAIRSQRDVLWCLVAMVAGIAVHALNGSLLLFTHFTSKGISGPRSSFITDNNHFAIALILCLPLLAYFGFRARSTLLKVASWGTLGACLLVAMGTWSRGGLVTLVALGGMVLFTLKTHRFRLIVLVVPVALAIWATLPEGFHKRMDTIDEYSEDASARGRIDAWKTAVSLASSEPFGGGFDHYGNRERWYRYGPEGSIPRAAHSIYFQVLGDHGYPGLLAYLWLLTAAFFAARRCTRAAPAGERGFDLTRAMILSVGSILVGGLFLSLAYWEALFFMIGLLFCLAEYLSPSQVLSSPVKAPSPSTGPRPGGRPRSGVVRIQATEKT